MTFIWMIEIVLFHVLSRKRTEHFSSEETRQKKLHKFVILEVYGRSALVGLSSR